MITPFAHFKLNKFQKVVLKFHSEKLSGDAKSVDQMLMHFRIYSTLIYESAILRPPLLIYILCIHLKCKT